MTADHTAPVNDHRQPSKQVGSSPPKSKKYLYWLLGLSGMGLLLLLVRPLVMTSANDPTVEAAARVLPVAVLEAEPVNSYQASRSYTGEIAAVRASNLGFNRSGEVERVLVEEGDRVSQGQALAQLDIRNLQTQRQQLLAEKARAQAQLSELKTGARIEDINAAEAAVEDLEQQLKLQSKQRERREYLYSQGAIAKEELDEFAFGAGALQARLNQAQSNLEELKNGTRQEQITAQQASVRQLEASIADLDVNIDKSTLKAPFNGIVAKRELDEGTVANAGQSVIRLMEDAAPEARIGLPVRAIEQLQIGSTQTLAIGSRIYQGEVTSILPEVDSDTRTQTVVFRLDPAAMTQVNPGQTIRLELTQANNAEGYWLPTDALTQGIRGLWTCYVLTEPKDRGAENTNGDPEYYVVQQHAVEIVNQSGDKPNGMASLRALVRGTLQPGDLIVANGTHRLVPGQRVRIIEH
ncbi:MAG: HlyD family efflux transporter periplasmic adaptor subunit [Cyanobacteria bacterium J06588_4]